MVMLNCPSVDFVFRFFFFNATAPSAIYTLSLHDALPILSAMMGILQRIRRKLQCRLVHGLLGDAFEWSLLFDVEDRKSTRLNSSHVAISYAVFCLKKKTDGFTIGRDTPQLPRWQSAACRV